MKRIICFFLTLAMLCAVVTACGSSDDREEKKTDVQALAQQMRAASQWPELLTVSSGDSSEQKGFSAISSLDYGKVDAYTLFYAADGSAYELAVIRLKDGADMPALEQSLKKHIEKRTESYRYYKPEQVPRAEGAVVAVHGAYAALVMCDDNAAVKAVFDKTIG